MTNQVRCPHCGKTQLPTIRVQTVESSADGAAGKEDPRKTLRVLLVLLLSLTIVGLPIAYWLCQRYEKEYPVRAEPILKYSYCCSLCGYGWTWRTDQPLTESLPRSSPERDNNTSILSTTPEAPSAHTSFFSEFLARRFRV